jgi:putative N6-adenine-specific DNA methylase
MHRHHGWYAVVLAGGPELPKAMAQKTDIDHRLWNGPLEIHLLRYKL